MLFLLLQCNFASKNLPKRFPRHNQNDEKIKSKSTCFLTSICLQLALHFGRFREPSWSQDWAKSASWEDLATNWAPRGRSWTLLQHFASILVRFGTNLGTIPIHFGRIFGRIWIENRWSLKRAWTNSKIGILNNIIFDFFPWPSMILCDRPKLHAWIVLWGILKWSESEVKWNETWLSEMLGPSGPTKQRAFNPKPNFSWATPAVR